ncbi:MAG: von Willebrand factor type A domain-containing protein [Acidiferrobacterales bacterium]
MNKNRLFYLIVAVSASITVSACSAPQSPVNDQAAGPNVVEKKEANLKSPVEPEAADVDSTVAQTENRRKLRSVAKTRIAPGMMMEQSMSMPSYGVPYNLRPPSEPINRENYAHLDENGIKLVSEHPVSTFSIDVDTGSYSNVRRLLNSGRLPRKDAVRVEEMINYFNYDYPLPRNKGTPFRVTTEIAPAPWNKNKHLLHIGIKGYNVAESELPPANLVFLVDVSGSMRSANKLGLLKSSLKLLSKNMDQRDRVTLVVYAGASGVVLDPTPGNQSGKIIAALDSLTAGGRTNGAAGIRLAYAMARQAYIKGGINRVILATDGDFNVGTVNFEALKNLVEEKRKSGITLTTLGFGSGNYNDRLMEQLADAGNGNYAYIDTLNEANKVLVSEMSSTLFTIAKDVKIQIEFNTNAVKEYRLIGYENRMLKREDFNNDKVDAGDIGAGHTVTALYEVTLTGNATSSIDPLRYGGQTSGPEQFSNELAFLKLRYKKPGGSTSKLIKWPLNTTLVKSNINETSNPFRFSAAVAGFGQLLRGGKYTKNFTMTDVRKLAANSRGKDRFGYRGEFVSLVSLADSLSVRERLSRKETSKGIY